jgi:hypothetical protein
MTSKSFTNVVKLNALPVNVQDFGTVGDGVTDDTTAFAAACNAAGVNGNLYVPAGTYKLTNLALNVAGQQWTFDPSATISSSDGLTTNAIVISANNVTIDGGLFDNLMPSGDVVDIACVRINNANGVKILNARFQKARGPCIRGVNASNLTITNNEFTDTWYAAVFVSPEAVDYNTITVSNNRIINTTVFAGYDYGINIHNDNLAVLGGQRIVIADNIISFPGASGQFPLGIELYGGNATSGLSPGQEGTITVCSVTGNVVNGCGIGISLSQISDAAVTGNTVKSSFSIGLEVVNGRNIAVTGNSVNGAQSGILVSGEGQGITVAANSVRGTTVNGINISQVKEHVAITGNTVVVENGNGIRLLSTSLASISGNTLEAKTLGKKAILLDKSDRCAIHGNIGANWTENAILVFADDAVTYNYITAVGNVWKNTPGSLALQTQLSGGAAIGRFLEYVQNVSDGDTIYSYDIHDTLNNVREIIGVGSPEGSFSAGRGSRYLRTDGGASTTLYVKESGTGNTGWVAK